ncbi:uncharacterized protein A4U43_C02F12360 [Asparagus officinalis]|uniref:Uncharacterized protein n=1 Tax=Asparagus officinalis TaxID=4686 RepID=A0A5P1FIL5_ASPOF|nr:uncharacterized protein A4U43_C02F12360 [Asparagus officinalis]
MTRHLEFAGATRRETTVADGQNEGRRSGPEELSSVRIWRSGFERLAGVGLVGVRWRRTGGEAALVSKGTELGCEGERVRAVGSEGEEAEEPTMGRLSAGSGKFGRASKRRSRGVSNG